jgi:hypothetical protein
MPDAKDKRVYIFNAHSSENCRAWLAALQAWHNVAVPLTREFCAALSANQLRLAYALLDKGSRAASNDGLTSSLTFRPANEHANNAAADNSSARDDADESNDVVVAPMPSLSPAPPIAAVDAVISAPQPATAEQLERASEYRQLAMAHLNSVGVVASATSLTNNINIAASAASAATTVAATVDEAPQRVWLPRDKRTVSSKEWRTTHPALNPAVAQWESEPFAAIHFQMCPMSLRHHLHYDIGARHSIDATNQRRVVDRRRVVSTPTYQSTSGSIDLDNLDVQQLQDKLRHERSIVDALQRMKVAFKAYDGATVAATESVLFAATSRVQQLESQLDAMQTNPTASDERNSGSEQPVAQRGERPALPPKPVL